MKTYSTILVGVLKCFHLLSKVSKHSFGEFRSYKALLNRQNVVLLVMESESRKMSAVYQRVISASQFNTEIIPKSKSFKIHDLYSLIPSLIQTLNLIGNLIPVVVEKCEVVLQKSSFQSLCQSTRVLGEESFDPICCVKRRARDRSRAVFT